LDREFENLEHIHNDLVARQPHINVRCPGCLKLFSVKTQEISEPRPQYQCNQCSDKFYLMFPECLGIGEIVGFPMHLKVESMSGPDDASGNHEVDVFDASMQSAESLSALNVDRVEEESLPEREDPLVHTPQFHCPRCEAPRKGGEKECKSCGVIFDKIKILEEAQRPNYPTNQKLNASWDGVMNHYEDEDVHDVFVESCQREGQLDFAAYKYRRILNAHAGDEIANKMMRKIEEVALATSGLSAHQKRPSKKTRFRWTTILAAIGIALIGMGYGIDPLRNLMGVGMAILFFSLTLRYYFR